MLGLFILKGHFGCSGGWGRRPKVEAWSVQVRGVVAESRLVAMELIRGDGIGDIEGRPVVRRERKKHQG